MGTRTGSLLAKFAIIFTLFTLIALAMSGVITFIQQTRIYKSQKEESLQEIASYLETVIEKDGEFFGYYTRYLTNHYSEIQIPVDFTSEDIETSRLAFSTKFAELYPSKVLGKDLSFDDLPKELKELFTVYYHEYYLDLFEKARADFNVPFTYVCIPTGEALHMYWMIDVDRVARESDGFMDLCFSGLMPYEKHQCMWQTWETGKRVRGYDYYDNEYGRTYAYYTPLIIQGNKLGVIGVEVEIANVDKAILSNSIRQIFFVGLALIVLVVLLLLYIYRAYISKLEHIKKNIREYTQNKDASVAKSIEGEATGNDEISVLALQVSSMILELENYMKSLLETAKELRDTQQKADAMSELATKDALTGIRNKTAYDAAVQKLEWKMHGEICEFAIAMIDLNYLKRLNDTFGHDKGNIAIKKLCHIVCHIFAHSPVFRIGGDEFVVILTGEDFENRERLCRAFTDKLSELAGQAELDPWEKVSASIGIATYDRAVDETVDNVFKRADKAMYAHKKEMKALREP